MGWSEPWAPWARDCWTAIWFHSKRRIREVGSPRKAEGFFGVLSAVMTSRVGEFAAGCELTAAAQGTAAVSEVPANAGYWSANPPRKISTMD